MNGEKYEIYTFNYLLALALSNVPDTMDKRQGSIIYDAIAPACYALAEVYQNIRNVYRDTSATTATGTDLDSRVAEQGIQRYFATHAVKKCYITDTSGNPMSVPIGARFSTQSDINPITYAIIDVYQEDGQGVPGYYQLQCEVAGSIGNEYAGTMTQITNIRGIGRVEMTTILVPARDEETDDELRERYFETINNKSYGGNIAQYREQVGAIPGVGGVQVYPVWNGGGTVKVSIVDSQKNACTPEFLALVQTAVDPENATGDQGAGLGLAPIGHSVTVDTPQELPLEIQATIILMSGYELGQVTASIKQSIDNYIYKLKEEWDKPDAFGQYSLAVYVSQISAAILSVKGVANVSPLLLNGSTADIILEQSGQLQQLPLLSKLTVNGVDVE